MFTQEGSYNLTLVFQEMATSTSLLDFDVHEVQDEWTGQRELQAAHQAAKSSPKDIHFFWLVPLTKSPKIMGLKGIHSPMALKWQTGLSFCPQCRKEGQNEGTVVNHLHTVHYCLGLICALCQDIFATSADTIKWYVSSCVSLTMKDKDWKEEEESKSNNGDENDRYLLTEI